MRILIADDDLTSRLLLSGVLRRHGYEVVETRDGSAALAAMQAADAPRLAILDWVMPGLDGLEVLQRLRAEVSERPPYIIMLTARGGKADVIQGLDAGANDYLSKPFDPGELRARIEVGRRMVEIQDALLESREKLAYQASHDILTGLLNRGAILAALGRAVVDLSAAPVEPASRVPLCLAMVDIDRFKAINDRHGHQTGDEVLAGLAAMLQAGAAGLPGASWSVGRLGGEEFLLVGRLPAPETAALQAGFEALRAQVAAGPIATRSGPISITVSIGVACADGDQAADALLSRADRALYTAKGAGRNQVVVD
ncbi:MAG: diguanylate cyclase [Xanthomonadales bacterium]|jgi:diguanylate cyclase (GGDEF)-like protein|nr:diguanylate cyclase [Xanthomonadales bacterium]